MSNYTSFTGSVKSTAHSGGSNSSTGFFFSGKAARYRAAFNTNISTKTRVARLQNGRSHNYVF